MATKDSGFPLKIEDIKWADKGLGALAYHPEGLLAQHKVGALVSIRPCAEEYEEKTYLGIYMGVIARSVDCAVDIKTEIMTLGFGDHNPAIFVPDLGKIIFGCESWWGEIKSPDELERITDDDIENIWYVKKLRAMIDKEKETGDE